MTAASLAVADASLTVSPSTDTPIVNTGINLQVGDIELIGEIKNLQLTRNSLLLAVHTIVLPDGSTTKLKTSRIKTIRVTPQTLFSTQAFIKKNLTDLKEREVLQVYGKDNGIGKPLTAQTILLP